MFFNASNIIVRYTIVSYVLFIVLQYKIAANIIKPIYIIDLTFITDPRYRDLGSEAFARCDGNLVDKARIVI